MSMIEDEHLGVVIVDDDPIFRELICAAASKKSRFVLFEAAGRDELFKVLNAERIDCIVLDYDLGGDTGLAIKQRMDEAYPDAPPTIMMTGDGRESTAIRAFRMGVCDYLPKRNLGPDTLVASVLQVVRRNRQDSLAKTEHRRLVADAMVDVVTGLESRARLEERLKLLASMAPRMRAAYALIFVELAGFTTIIDQFGFKNADKILLAAGKKLKQLVRSEDVCGRYDDATFLVIADARSDQGLLDGMCRRLSDGLMLRQSLDAADVEFSAYVAGSLCEGATLASAHDIDGLLRPVTDALATIKASAPLPSAANDPPSVPPAVSAGADTTVIAVAERLRTSDRRSAPRQRIFKRGLIHFIGTASTMNCVVRNLSSTGAAIRVEAPIAVPASFDLEIVGAGRKRRALVRWQIASDVGIEFVEDLKPAVIA